MSVDGQMGRMYQGTDRTITVAIPIGSSGLDHTDVSAATIALVSSGTAALTKTIAAAQITATTSGTNILLTCALAPVDTASLSGVYAVECLATIDGVTDIRATGTLTIVEAVTA